MVGTAAAMPWVLAIAIAIASRHQATRSSIEAQASARVPSGVLSSCRSVRMRASTGKAVIDRAAPMNTAKDPRAMSGRPFSSYSTFSARTAPSSMGSRMLMPEMANDSLSLERRCSGSTPSPTRNMKKISPTCASR